MTREQIIKAMQEGAILHRSDCGASTWCHLEYPDGTTQNLPTIHGIERDDLLEPIVFDSRKVPTQYKLKGN